MADSSRAEIKLGVPVIVGPSNGVPIFTELGGEVVKVLSGKLYVTRQVGDDLVWVEVKDQVAPYS